MDRIHLNYLAVLVSAVAAFMIGGLWYEVLFKKTWVAAHGISPERMAEMKKRGRAMPFIGNILANIVTAAALAVLISYLNLHFPMQGAKLGFLVWAGFAAMISLIANLYSDTKISGFVVDASYQLVYLVMMGAILTAWR
jgi:hypothetical protein